MKKKKKLSIIIIIKHDTSIFLTKTLIVQVLNKIK